MQGLTFTSCSTTQHVVYIDGRPANTAQAGILLSTRMASGAGVLALQIIGDVDGDIDAALKGSFSDGSLTDVTWKTGSVQPIKCQGGVTSILMTVGGQTLARRLTQTLFLRQRVRV